MDNAATDGWTIHSLYACRKLCVQFSPLVWPARLQWFFFLWFGRSRSKARSLHETKLLIRKLLHGRRRSHEAWQIITRKTTNTPPTNKNRARRRSPSQICVLPFERQQSKQPTGPEPNKKNHKRFAKDTAVKTHCVTIKTKTCSKRIMPPRNVRHANYVVASKATCTIHCKLTQPLRVHSQVLVHVPKFRERPSTRWHKHQQVQGGHSLHIGISHTSWYTNQKTEEANSVNHIVWNNKAVNYLTYVKLDIY